MPDLITRTGRVVLVLGGTRSGKSHYAQKLAEHWWPRPLYLATAEILDAEMAARVQLHQGQRGQQWTRVEEPLDVARVILGNTPLRDGILLDCVTIWLTNVLLKEGESAIQPRKEALLDALRRTSGDVILVSNEVGMGVVPDTKLGRQFRDLQGWMNQDIAAVADTVIFVIAGLPLVLKGVNPCPPG
jgi:adenosylcobinamide kinase/adenosylcobinamide-phosphate guanylyltransferase